MLLLLLGCINVDWCHSEMSSYWLNYIVLCCRGDAAGLLCVATALGMY